MSDHYCLGIEYEINKAALDTMTRAEIYRVLYGLHSNYYKMRDQYINALLELRAAQRKLGIFAK